MLGFIITVTLFPVYWMITGSFKTFDELADPKLIIPPNLSLKNYYDVLSDWSFLIQIKNSILLAVGTATLTLVLAVPAAYSLARIKFKGIKFFTRSILFTYLIPSSILIVPYFKIISSYGLYNTYVAVILVDTVFTTPFCILILKEYFGSIPKEIEESAFIDGANIKDVIFRITLPLSAPALAAIATFAFLYSWNEYLYIIVLMGSSDMFTVPVGLGAKIASDIMQYVSAFAMSTLFTVPSVIFYLLIEKYLVAGLTVGAVKG
jgi:multiple sugar transport system permease protein